MNKTNTLTCPECGAEIDIDEVLNSQINNTVNDKVKAEKEKLEKQLRLLIEEEQSDQIKSLQKELTEKSGKLKEFNKAKAEVERLKREKSELREEIEAESQKKFSDQLNIEKDKIRKSAEEKSELKIIEKEHLIEKLKMDLKETQERVERGSQQTQGEVQEIAIEEFLKENFKLDTIDEIKKGARGADCQQIINTREKQNCGSIYYESKRTKAFQPSWIEKFRNDMRDKSATIGVLVTDTMPGDMKRLGQKDGVWICTYQEFKGLCFVLRESTIQISNAVSTQENKGDKMVMLYDYLTSNEFRLQIEAIVEGFTQMKRDLDTEKRSIQGHWKKREKQIEKVLLNTTFMYSSIKGIAGSAVQPLKALEMGVEEDLEIDKGIND